jgi:hypothetical protein
MKLDDLLELKNVLDLYIKDKVPREIIQTQYIFYGSIGQFLSGTKQCQDDRFKEFRSNEHISDIDAQAFVTISGDITTSQYSTQGTPERIDKKGFSIIIQKIPRHIDLTRVVRNKQIDVVSFIRRKARPYWSERRQNKAQKYFAMLQRGCILINGSVTIIPAENPIELYRPGYLSDISLEFSYNGCFR